MVDEAPERISEVTKRKIEGVWWVRQDIADARIKQLEQALRDVRAEFFKDAKAGWDTESNQYVDDSLHPWIPGARAPEVIALIDAALAEEVVEHNEVKSRSIVEAAREKPTTTLGDLIERYDYEIVRDALWTLKPDPTGQLWCGDCRRYVKQVAHDCSGFEEGKPCQPN